MMKSQFVKNLQMLVFIGSLLLSCSNKKTDFFTIPVNPDDENPIQLSEIAENIKPIELELTDESLIQRVLRVIVTDQYIFILQRREILLFDNAGKFIRQIGTIGQGPGEYSAIIDITLNNEKENLYVLTTEGKIISYDFKGDFIKESPSNYYEGIGYLNYINNKLLHLGESFTSDGMKETKLHRINEELLKKDSIIVCTISSVRAMGVNPYNDFISKDGNDIYLYCSDVLPNPFILDTLYKLQDDQQVTPYLNLSFNTKAINATGEKRVSILNIYKSSRFIFSYYSYGENVQFYCFCYDTVTKKGYIMEEGYIDDMYTGERVKIRPFDSDANRFYYLHTHLSDQTKEEPNPTLYIGTLKK